MPRGRAGVATPGLLVVEWIPVGRVVQDVSKDLLTHKSGGKDWVPGPMPGTWVIKPTPREELHPADRNDPEKWVGSPEYRKKHTDPDGTYWGADAIYMHIGSDLCPYPDCDLYGYHFHREGEVYFSRDDYEELKAHHARQRQWDTNEIVYDPSPAGEVSSKPGWIKGEFSKAEARMKAREFTVTELEKSIEQTTKDIFGTAGIPKESVEQSSYTAIGVDQGSGNIVWRGPDGTIHQSIPVEEANKGTVTNTFASSVPLNVRPANEPTSGSYALTYEYSMRPDGTRMVNIRKNR